MSAHLWKATVVVGLVAGPLLLWSDASVVRDLVWIVTMSLTAVAVVVGIRVFQPSRTGAWWLLAVSLVLFAASLVVAPSAAALAPDDPSQLLGDGLNLAGFILLGVVAQRFVRYQTPQADRDGLVDALIVMVALATVLWTVVFTDDAAAVGLTARATLAVVFLVPAWVAALCVRLVMTSGAHLMSARLLGGAGLTLFAVTLLWALSQFTDLLVPLPLADLVWLAAILGVMASPLHPSMRGLTEPAPTRGDAVSAGRLIVLGVALMAIPAALLQLSDSFSVNILIPVGGSALLALLVLLRLARLVGDRERARHEVAIRAAHQAALSRLTADALSNQALTDLYEAAEQLLDAAVAGAKTRIRTDVTGGRSPQPSQERLLFPITGMDRPVAVIEAVTEPGAEIDAEARQFLHAVADVLAAAVQRRQIEVELEHRATHDPLTGLPNRVQLFDRLEQALLRRGEHRIGLLYVDLDGFKAVNDTYGHEAGDRVLVILAERMRAIVRGGDTVARLSGDEFVVLVDPSTWGELPIVAERLLEKLAEPMEIAGASISMGASIGAAVSEPGLRLPESLLRQADEAMYRAKQRPETSVVLANDS